MHDNPYRAEEGNAGRGLTRWSLAWFAIVAGVVLFIGYEWYSLWYCNRVAMEGALRAQAAADRAKATAS